MERIFIDSLDEHIEETVIIKGWIDIRRDHGKLIFLDIRDMSGKIQAVVLPQHPEAKVVAETLRSEWVIEAEGLVHKRPEKLINKDEKNGEIEIEITKIEVINSAETPPIDLHTDGYETNEEARLKYRYLDLRRERLQKNIRLRSKFVDACRQYLFANRFTEIETPLLTKATPEGSRDFLVPSRLQPGKFYALPQSPQQYKQLLMAAAFERYFQTARAIRDEDLRADRGFEHTQIDIEMSFVKQEDVLQLIEGMITKVVTDLGFKIKQTPFPRFTYKETMEKFGADKFDMRTEKEKKEGVLAYAWVIDFPFFEKTDDGKWTFTHNPFSMPKEEHLEWHMKGENIDKILTTQYDIVCNGYEAGGGSIRAHKPEILRATYKNMGYTEEMITDSIGHMLEAFSFGTPPHGGIALGVERNIMNLTGESALRESQAFPMTGKGQTSVMDAPNEATPAQLAELGISIRVKQN